VNRGDGKPTANIVVFSFLSPLDLLRNTTNGAFLHGVPRGMTKKVVQFFQSKGILVVFSIGGESFSSNGNWDQALADATTLARNAAVVAKTFGVGMEIDYEVDNAGKAAALNNFVKAYRQIIPQSEDPSAILSVDMGSDLGYLEAVAKLASQWLSSNMINFANAMVSDKPWQSISEAASNWDQHLKGNGNVPAIDPSKMLVSLYTSNGAKNCHNWSGTVLEQAVPWVQQNSVRGIMFWAAGCVESCVQDCTGVEQGSKLFMP